MWRTAKTPRSLIVSDITTETKHDVIKDKAFDNAALLTLLFDAV